MQEIMQEQQAKYAKMQKIAKETGKSLDEVEAEMNAAEEAEKAAKEKADAEKVEAQAEDAVVVEVDGEVVDASTEPSFSEEKEGAEEAKEAVVASQAKMEAAKAAREEGEDVGGGVKMLTQKEVNLAQDLDERDRKDIYKNFLMYCMTGYVVRGPMGVVMNVERDEADFARLGQLGDVLGLSQFEVSEIHRGMSEQAFKSQVEGIMGSGAMNTDHLAKVEELREQLQLDEATADKVIASIRAKNMASTVEAFRQSGQLTLDKVLAAAADGVDVADFMAEDSRLSLFRTEVERWLSDGDAVMEADAASDLVGKLALEKVKTDKMVVEIAKGRRRLTMVQAVSGLRQKKADEVKRSLNNLVSCERAAPEGAMEWKEREEVKDLFCVYAQTVPEEPLRQELAKVLGLTESEVTDLTDLVASGKFKLVGDAETSESAFF